MPQHLDIDEEPYAGPVCPVQLYLDMRAAGGRYAEQARRCARRSCVIDRHYARIEAHQGLPARARHCLGVVVEVCQLLTPWRHEFCLIGGWAVYALTEVYLQGQAQPPLRHRGSMDVEFPSHGLRCRRARLRRSQCSHRGRLRGARQFQLATAPSAGTVRF